VCALPYLVLTLCISACVWTKPDADLPPAPVVTGVSRVIIPTAGGQTIRLPRLMEDAITLWKPLSRQEQRLSGAKLNIDLKPSGSNVAFWLPASEHDDIRRYLYRLAHDSRELTTRVLSRAELYMPIIVEGVRQQGLPPEIACLPLVESAFEPQSVSSAGAAGLWQLMPETAREFGLKVTSTEDERFDIYKSTKAATAYLEYLYRFFKNWPLAIAAYNCGEGKMQKALKETGCTTLDGLIAYCRNSTDSWKPLKEETLRYVPQFAAAVIAMTNAEGLGIFPHSPLKKAPVTMTGRDENTEKLSLAGRYDDAGQPAPSPVPPQSARIR
jgi:membrane-bound lytic murein transglycosylase D